MSWNYRWMLDEGAYAFLRALKRRDQRKLERELDLLRTQPFTEPAMVEVGAHGEALFFRFVGDYAVVYHVDHAARCVFIQQIFKNS